MSKKKLLEFGLKEADAFQKNFKIFFDRLVRGYKSMMNKEPEGLDLLKIKMEAREKALGTTKVVNQKGLTLDPDKPIMGGTQEGIPTIKTKFDEELDEFNLSKDDPMGDLEKIVKGEGETGLPKKEAPEGVKNILEEELGVKLYGDETFDELMIIKNTGKHPRDMADGGIIGTAKNIIGSGLDKGSDIGRFILSAASGIPGLGFVVDGLRALGDKTFSNLPIGDQLFITEQMGIQGLDDQSGLPKDKYGYNIRSMFGNYADLVSKRAKLAEDRRRKGLEQRAIDEYYTNLEKQRQAAEAEAQRRAITSITQGYGGADDRRDATGPTAAGAGMGVGGGYASDYGFLKDGGLATMFVEKR